MNNKHSFHFPVSFKKHNKPLSIIYQFPSKNFLFRLLLIQIHRWEELRTIQSISPVYPCSTWPFHPTHTFLGKGQRTFINLERNKQKIYTFLCRSVCVSLMRTSGLKFQVQGSGWSDRRTGEIGNFRLLI